MAVECGHVAATNLRLIHHIARSGAPVFRELPYTAVQGLKLTQRPRITTVVLGALIAALSLLAGPGTPLQLAAGGLGVAAVLLGIIFGDLSLEISTATGGAKPQRWPMREVSRRESETLVSVARAWMDGGYDLVSEPVPAPLAPSAIARSILLLPADDAAQTLAAMGGNADTLCLDMTTLVHPSRRAASRELVPSAIAVAKQAGRRVWVRVNIDDAEADLAAAVWPGLTAVVATAVSPGGARQIDSLLTDLEREREVPERVRIVVQVENAAGVWALRETLAATPRISAAMAATHDVLDLLGRVDNRATWTTLLPPALPETAHLRGRIAAAAMEAGVPVYACLATSVAPGGLTEALGGDAMQGQRITEAAAAAWAYGYRGAVTLHPAAIDACNAALQGPCCRRARLTLAAPVPSKWQPVVPSHFGIGLPKPPAAQVEGTSRSGAFRQSRSPHQRQRMSFSLRPRRRSCESTWRRRSGSPSCPHTSASGCRRASRLGRRATADGDAGAADANRNQTRRQRRGASPCRPFAARCCSRL